MKQSGGKFYFSACTCACACTCEWISFWMCVFSVIRLGVRKEKRESERNTHTIVNNNNTKISICIVCIWLLIDVCIYALRSLSLFLSIFFLFIFCSHFICSLFNVHMHKIRLLYCLLFSLHFFSLLKKNNQRCTLFDVHFVHF